MLSAGLVGASRKSLALAASLLPFLELADLERERDGQKVRAAFSKVGAYTITVEGLPGIPNNSWKITSIS